MNLSDVSIQTLQRAIQQGEITAHEVAQHTLQAIEQHNPALNAWTAVTGPRMLQEARAVDAQRQRGESLPPLAGIPYAVKNLFDVAGHSTLAGASLFRDRPAAQTDAFAVDKLRHAGALLSGMLNMFFFDDGSTTENSHYGATRNPRDLSRVAGGSSGGSAAAVAAGLVHFSLGTDTNGSIRVPASLCGIFGLKPTFGRLSRSGSHPFVASLDHIGPLARRVDDLALVYDQLQGADPADAFQANHPQAATLPSLAQGSEGLRCGVLGGFFARWCDEDARAAVAAGAAALDAHEEVLMPEAELARSAAFIMTAAEGGNHYLPALRQVPEQFEPNSRERLMAGAMMPGAWYVQAQRFRRHFRQQVLPLFNHFDVLIAPATPCSAIAIGQQTLSIQGESLPAKASMGMLTQPISFLGLPVCTVPLATRSGLPIGLQLIGRPFDEEAVLRAAWTLEQRGITLPQITMAGA